MRRPDRGACSSLVELILADEAVAPDRQLFTFLERGETPGDTLTSGGLAERARPVAALLQSRAGAGSPILIVVPDRLEFIVAFVACLMAGNVAVPALPPTNRRAVERLRRIVVTARPDAVLTLDSMRPVLASVLEPDPQLPTPSWCTLEEAQESPPGSWRPPSLEREAIALLQYSSGSTGDPKGVIVSHGNLLENCRLLEEACQPHEASRLVSWLPFHHDWGLIGCVVFPIYEGMPSVLFEASRFLAKPACWLQAISRFRATISCAPNFAYEMCLDGIGAEERRALDLSAWEVAMVGAEPVRWETIERFGAAFRGCGFRQEAFFPTYGLAENTLIVSGGPPLRPPARLVLDRPGLEEHRATEVAEGAPQGSRVLVGSGRPRSGQEVMIVDPAGDRRCGPGEVGEIWVAGPSVAQGYWGEPDRTRDTFCATLADEPGRRFLRTGDLGFEHDGELFVCGRLKDLIIKAGRNYFAEDVERAAGRGHPSLRPGFGAAFAVDEAGAERLVIVHELKFRERPDPGQVIGRIQQAVFAELSVLADAIVILPPGSLDKTTSGKVRRQRVRARFLADGLEPVGSWKSWSAPVEPSPTR